MKLKIAIATLLVLSSFAIVNQVKADETTYFTYSEFKNEMQSLANNYSEIAELYTLGKTINGREILALKISDNPKINETEQSILIVGGHHGNEKISVMFPFLLAKYLLENSEKTRIAKLIEEKQIFIIPMLNPDGYEKNQRYNDNGTGVDLNRNYNYEWVKKGKSHGEFPFSEYETQAIRNLTASIPFSIAMTFHSYGEQITYPWAYTTNKTKDDALLKKIAQRYSAHNNYAVMQDSSLYITKGDFNDFMYGNRSSLSFTVELAKENSPTEISKVFYENLNSSLYLIELTGEEENALLPLWTFAVYMSGDNDLEDEGIDDLNEMEIVGSSEDVNIVVQFDRADSYDTTNGNWKTAKRFYVKKDNNTANISSQEIKDIGEVDMSNKDTLYNFLVWVVENYPAQHYFVDIWNHGKDIFNGVIRDDSHGGKFMKLWDLADALKKFKEQKGIKLSIIGFDVCTLGFIETAYQLNEYGEYLLASEKEEPLDGWLYNMSLQRLVENPYLSAEDFGKEIVNDYIGSYKNGIQSTSVSIQLALTDLYRIKNLTNSLNELSIELINNSYSYNSAIKNARNKTESYENSDFVDLFHFTKLIYEDNSLPNSLREKANNFMGEFNKTVVANGKYQKTSSVNNANGLVIYFEKNYANYNSIYDNSTKIYFANEKWNEFLKAFYKVPIIEHTKLKDDIVKEFYRVSAKIIDDNLNSTSVYYKTISSFIKLNMSFIGNSTYVANIPYENSSIVYYYIEAKDNNGNVVKTETYFFRIGNSTLKGKVIDNFGNPISNIVVGLFRQTKVSSQYGDYYNETDENGNYKIENIPSDNYILRTFSDKYNEISMEINLLLGEIKELNLTLYLKEIQLQIKVIDWNGTNLNDVSIAIENSFIGKTDDNGNLTTILTLGIYNITAYGKIGYGNFSAIIDLSETNFLTIKLPKLCKLYGTTKKYDGEILKNILIFIENERYNFTATSDNNGNFVINDIPYGNYRIFAIGTDYVGITNNFTLSQNPFYLNITMVYLVPKLEILFFNYSSAIENESFEIQLTLKNFGINAVNYTIEFYVGNQKFNSTAFNISSLQTLTINTTFKLQKGNYKIKAIVLNETGLEKEISVNVKEKPNAKLVIDNIEITIQKKDDENTIIRAIVKNVGNKIAENVLIKIFIDGKLMKNESANISSSYIAELNLNLEKGKHEVRVEVSYGNETLNLTKELVIKDDEENRSNNNLQIALVLIFAVIIGWLISVWVRWKRGKKK